MFLEKSSVVSENWLSAGEVSRGQSIAERLAR